MKTQAEKGEKFWQMHQGPGAFVIPNPWDAGSARLLVHQGFGALASSSAGYAFSMGRRDNTTSRTEMMAHVRAIAAAVPDTPVSGDLENGFGDRPEDAAQTIREAAEAGLVGGSIEDATTQPYEFSLAVERVRAAVEAARSLPFRFTLTARCENFLVGPADLADTIRRLQAYEAAGADVLYAPGLTRRKDIAELIRSVGRPVNVLCPAGDLTRDQLAELGARRLSVGSGLARAAYSAMLRAGEEMLSAGTFGFSTTSVSFAEISARMSR